MVTVAQDLEQYSGDARPNPLIRVVSYNIRKSLGLDRRRNPLRILDVLKEVDADIVFLQEVDRRIGRRASTLKPEMLQAHTDYHAADVAIRSDSLGWHGNVLLVKNRVKFVKTWRIDLPTLEPRGAIAADIIIDDHLVRCVATHLALVAGVRRAQVNILSSALHDAEGDPPTIIAGDFNEWRKTNSCVDLFGESYRAATPTPSFHSALPVAALDRIVVSNDIAFLQAGVHQSKKSKIASDHLPLWADLRLTRARQPAG